VFDAGSDRFDAPRFRRALKRLLRGRGGRDGDGGESRGEDEADDEPGKGTGPAPGAGRGVPVSKAGRSQRRYPDRLANSALLNP
jgi:hypothetical protein